MQDTLYKAEDNAALRIWWDTRKNEFQSSERGKPVYDKVLLVEVISPGSKESIPVIEVLREFDEESGLKPRKNEREYSNYKRQIEAFLNNEESPDLLGTPLNQWPALDIAQIASLREMKIFTVEALAGLSDSKIQTLGMGGRELVARAGSFLNAAKGGAEVERLGAENARLHEDVERLTEQVKELSERLQEKLDKEEMAPAPTRAKRTV